MTSIFQPLNQTIVNLVQGASTPQRLLDAAYWADVREWGALARTAGIPLDAPLLKALAPTRLQFAQTEIEVQMAIESRRERGFDVSARLNGAVVCSFFEARYGSTETRWNRLRLEVVPVPTQRKDNNK